MKINKRNRYISNINANDFNFKFINFNCPDPYENTYVISVFILDHNTEFEFSCVTNEITFSLFLIVLKPILHMPQAGNMQS